MVTLPPNAIGSFNIVLSDDATGQGDISGTLPGSYSPDTALAQYLAFGQPPVDVWSVEVFDLDENSLTQAFSLPGNCLIITSLSSATGGKVRIKKGPPSSPRPPLSPVWPASPTR